jgi:hypothetical protein
MVLTSLGLYQPPDTSHSQSRVGSSMEQWPPTRQEPQSLGSHSLTR